jgi:hypothetical protein
MAAGTMAVLGTGASIYQIAQGAKDANESEEALAGYERQELNNVYKDIQISTVGSDLMKEQSDLGMASMTDMARTGGVRGIMGALPRIQAESNHNSREARKYLDDQDIQRKYAAAGDERRIQGMTEQRENSEISGLGQQLEVGRQTMWNGISGLGNSITSGITNSDFGGLTPQVSEVSRMATNGVSTSSYDDMLKKQQDEMQRNAFVPNQNF